jgi:hypothetical protein
VIEFQRADQRSSDHSVSPPPLTWDYAVRMRKAGGFCACQSDMDVALCTCGNGHTCRLTLANHQIAADGTVTPSYACPVTGCSYHVTGVRLVGWDPSHEYEVVDV